jgi:hypothetical protein
VPFIKKRFASEGGLGAVEDPENEQGLLGLSDEGEVGEEQEDVASIDEDFDPNEEVRPADSIHSYKWY